MKQHRIRPLVLTVLFCLLTGGVGLKSFVNLADFYIDDQVNYNEWTVALGDRLETDMATTFFQKFDFVNLNGLMRRILGQREMNEIIKLNNGYLMNIPEAFKSRIDDAVLIHNRDDLKTLQRYLAQRGSHLIFAVGPYTSSPYDPELPAGIEDYGNENLNRYMEILQDSPVNVIDFRAAMHENGIDQYDMMYRTDHHWTTEGGFYAYRQYERLIKELTGCHVDARVSDPDQYSIREYKRWHLGSRGQRTGVFFAGIDDFHLIVPNFDTFIHNQNGESGRMEEILFDMEPLERRDFTSRYTYDSVLSPTLGHFVNEDCDNEIRILYVADSFGKAVIPFFTLGFHEVMTMQNSDVSKLTKQAIEDFDPDVVILQYYAEYALNEYEIPEY